jgi:hypothetical protein
MRSLAAAFGLVGVAGVGTFVLLNFLATPEGFSIPLSTMLLGAFPYVHEAIEKRPRRIAAAAQAPRTVGLRGFNIPWFQALLYATAIAFTVNMASAFATAFVFEASGEIEDTYTLVAALIPVVLPVAAILTSFLIGSWVGLRSDRLAYLVSAVSIYVALLAVELVFVMIDPNLISELDTDSSFSGVVGAMFGPFVLTLVALPSVVLSVIAALIGCRRGRRSRLSAYVAHLLGALPEDTRETLVQLAYDEAQRLKPDMPTTGQVPATAPPTS